MRSLSKLLLAGLVMSASAFSITPAPLSAVRAQRSVKPAVALAPHRPTQRLSRVAPVRMGLFGLGGPEIAVIGVVLIFVLGPETIKSLAKDAGKMSVELKEVSAEALEGMKEVSASAAKELQEKSGPALNELKATATPVLSEFKDAALKEVKDVAVSFNEGTKAAEVPTGPPASAADSDNKPPPAPEPEAKA